MLSDDLIHGIEIARRNTIFISFGTVRLRVRFLKPLLFPQLVWLIGEQVNVKIHSLFNNI